MEKLNIVNLVNVRREEMKSDQVCLKFTPPPPIIVTPPPPFFPFPFILSLISFSAAPPRAEKKRSWQAFNGKQIVKIIRENFSYSGIHLAEQLISQLLVISWHLRY